MYAPSYFCVCHQRPDVFWVAFFWSSPNHFLHAVVYIWEWFLFHVNLSLYSMLALEKDLVSFTSADFLYCHPSLFSPSMFDKIWSRFPWTSLCCLEQLMCSGFKLSPHPHSLHHIEQGGAPLWDPNKWIIQTEINPLLTVGLETYDLAAELHRLKSLNTPKIQKNRQKKFPSCSLPANQLKLVTDWRGGGRQMWGAAHPSSVLHFLPFWWCMWAVG